MHTPLTDAWRESLTRAGYTVDDEATQTHSTVVVVRDDHRTSLTVVTLPDDEARARCAEHLARWHGVDDPGVDQLSDAVDLDDAVALLRPHVGETLAEFVDLQGRLSAGQVSTVLVVLGRTLARLHADGLVYGRMTADDVVVVDGQPRLVVPRPEPDRGHALPPSPAEDAYHLAALADSVIAAAYGADAPARPAATLRALHRMIVSALGDAASRPGVGTLASQSHDIAACQPLVVLEPPPADVVAEDDGAAPGTRGRPRRRAVLVTCGLLVALMTTGMWWNGLGRGDDAVDVSPPPSADEVASEIEGPPDGPAAAAAALTVGRFDLLARMTAIEPAIDAREWERITVLGSPAHAQALELVAVLVADGSSLTGLSATVESATLLDEDARTARVEVVYATSEYAVRTVDGSSVVPAREAQLAVLTLVRTDAGWRVSDVAENDGDAADQDTVADGRAALGATAERATT